MRENVVFFRILKRSLLQSFPVIKLLNISLFLGVNNLAYTVMSHSIAAAGAKNLPKLVIQGLIYVSLNLQITNQQSRSTSPCPTGRSGRGRRTSPCPTGRSGRGRRTSPCPTGRSGRGRRTSPCPTGCRTRRRPRP